MTKPVDRCLCAACLETEYEQYKHARVHELLDLNERWLKEFKINDWPRWDYELESCALTFSDNGEVRVIAEIEAVGTVNGDEWEWSWGNAQLPEQCRSRIGAVREFGEEKEWSKLTNLFIESDEYLGWELTAIAAHILRAKGAYRCPDEAKSGNFLYVAILDAQFIH